jgi:hypothetical protein
VRNAGYRPAPPIEVEQQEKEKVEEEEEMPFTGQNKVISRLILFPSTGLSVSA